MRDRVAVFLATAGYVGYLPLAPGTFGSAVGLGIYAALQLVDHVALDVAVLLGGLLVGAWSAEVLERRLGKDPSPVVIDEVLGMLITLAFLNVTLLGAAIAFLIFRTLDVVKPPPAARLENLHGGPGIMLDDVMAGVYGNLTMHGLIVLFPGTLV